LRQFSVYAFVGLTCFFLELALFKILTAVIGVYSSNFIAIFLASQFSFFINSRFNFKVTNYAVKRYIKFFLVIQLGTLLSDVELMYLLRYFSSIEAKILSMPLVVALQFFFNKKWVFSK
jgi:putative flippase GtrA